MIRISSFQPRFGMRHVLIGLRETASVGVVKPAMIIAAQPASLDIAIGEIGAAMPAVAVDKAETPAAILIEDEILAQKPHRLRTGLVEFAGAGDWPPIAAQQIAHRRSSTGLGQQFPAVVRFLCFVLHHR